MIERLENTPFSEEDVFQLIRRSFARWGEAGLDTSLLRMTLEEYHRRLEGQTVLVSYENDSPILGVLAFYCWKPREGMIGAYLDQIAVNPDTARKGIATDLWNKALALMKEAGVDFVESDTAIRAKWSKKWHRKNGFHITGVVSFNSNNYLSYMFRQRLSEKGPRDGLLIRTLLIVKSVIKLIRYRKFR